MRSKKRKTPLVCRRTYAPLFYPSRLRALCPVGSTGGVRNTYRREKKHVRSTTVLHPLLAEFFFLITDYLITHTVAGRSHITLSLRTAV
jgi:hypothetical protein